MGAVELLLKDYKSIGKLFFKNHYYVVKTEITTPPPKKKERRGKLGRKN